MTIAQINACYHFSSTGRTTEEMHKYIQNNGHNSIVITSSSTIKENGIFVLNNKFSSKLHSAFHRLFGLQGLMSIKSTIDVIKILSNNKVNVVVLRNLHACYINLPILFRYLYKNRIPVIAVMHDCWFYTGMCCYYADINCNKWKTSCSKCPKYHNSQLFPLIDSSALLFDIKKSLFFKINLNIVGVSDWITKESSHSTIFRNAQSYNRIYNWIDFSVFKPSESDNFRQVLSISDNDFVILAIAQVWIPYKGLPIILDLAKYYSSSKVIIIGSVSDKEKQKASGNIIWIDSIDDIALLAKYYSVADVFVNACIQETFGKVSAEALSCGTPVVTNQFTANPELVNQDCGIIVNEYNSAAYIDAVNVIKNVGKKYYSHSCVERAHMLFDMDKNMREYLSLFKRVQIMQ